MCEPIPASAEGVEQDVPLPDEYTLATSAEPSEGRVLREHQVGAAEGSQDEYGWEEA